VEIDVDYGLTDIVADRYDAGVRFGDQVAKDMIAVRIGPDLRLAIVGSPSYFAARPEPRSPRDLVNHKCINFRQPSAGGLYAWEFEKRERELRVRVDGQLIFNRMPPLLDAARAGFGLACVMDDMAEADVAEGRLTRVLADW
jgi:DNA-binding transcriptional LysR family regulator